MSCYDYYYTKQLIAINFSKNAKQYFSKAHLTDQYLDFLYRNFVLRDIVMINEQMKYNLLDLLNYIRFDGNLNVEGINKLNEIMIHINRSKISFYPYQCYLAEEFDIRMPDGKVELNFLNDNQINELLGCIELDFTVLNSLLCDEKEYEDMIFPDLILNEFYFGSINKLSMEIPEIISKKNDRIMQIIFINKMYKKKKYKQNITDFDAGMFKVVLKCGNKLLKKMNK